MTDRKLTIGTAVDTTGARQGLGQLKQEVSTAVQSIKSEGAEGAKGLAAIGAGADQAAKEVDAAAAKFGPSIKRAMSAAQRELATLNTQLQGTGKSQAAWFEELAKVRGTSIEIYRPLLNQLREVEAAQQAAREAIGRTTEAERQAQAAHRAAAGQLDGVGMSAKATAAALRQVPAQFQDIIVSLQGGQAPLTVLLQQGSQLATTFGGVGAGARALGGYIASLITPVTALGAVAAVLAFGLHSGAAEAQAFQREIVLSGNAAGTTAGQLGAMAARLDEAGLSQSRAAEILAQLAATGQVGAASFERITLAAANFADVGGSAVEDTVEAFAKLGRDPLQASVKLNESFNYLTRSTYEQIKALEEAGRQTDAARVAQNAFADAIEQRTPALRENLGYVETAWLAIKKAAGEAADALKDYGRPETIEGQIKRLQAAQATNQQWIGAGLFMGQLSEANAAIQQQINMLSRRLVLQKEAAAAESQQAQSTKDLVDADKLLERLGVKRLTLAQEERAVREQLLRAGKDEKTIQEAIAAVREKRADKKADTAAQRELETQAKLLAQLSGLAGDFHEDWDRLNKQFREGKLSVEQLTAAQAELLSKQPAVREEAKAQADALKDLEKTAAALTKAEFDRTEALDRSAASVAAQVQRLRDEEAAAAIAKISNISLAQAIEQVAIARLQEQQAALMRQGDRDADVLALQKEIDARRQLAVLIGNKDAREASRKASEEMARDNARAAERMQSDITNALLRGFESGKTAAENFRDTVENMFKTLILRPTIEAGVSSAFGLPSAGGAGQGGSLGGLGNLLSMGQNLYSFLNGGMGASIGNSAAFGAEQLGQWLVNNTGGYMNTLGGSLMQNSGSIGNFAGSVGGAFGNAALGYGISKAISGGYSAGGWVNTAAGIASAIPGIGPIAGVVGGLVNRAFGRKLKDSGLEGTFGGDTGFEGNTFEYYKGGWFRSSKTKRGELDAGTESALGDQFLLMRGQTTAMAEILGVGTEAIKGFSTSIKVSLKGLSEEAAQAKLQEEFARIGDSLAGLALGSSDFGKDGESAAQTLARLSGSLQGVNAVLEGLGQTAYSASLASGDMADQLLGLFGGLEGLARSSQAYYEAYYSEAERAAIVTAQVTKQLGEYGIALPVSRDAYRDLVEAQDLTTESGRKAYAALLQLAPAFASVTEAAADGADAMARAAEQAAEAGRRSLASLAEEQAQLLIDRLRAGGDTGGAASAERDRALAQALAGVADSDQAAIRAAFARNEALRAEIAELERVTAAEATRTEQRLSQEQQILQLEGNTAALRQRELESLDPVNRARQEHIYKLLDEQAAAQAAAQAEATRTQQRLSQEQQILQLEGNTAELRRRELESLDPANRARQEYIYKLQDEQAAMQAAAQQLALFTDRLSGLQRTRFDLENQLLGLQGNTAEVMRRNRERDLAELTKGLSSEEAAKIIAAYDANATIARQIEEIEAARQAAAEAARAAEQLRQAWQGVADGIFDEVARIRGVAKQDGGAGFAAVQAQFAIASAQARAGDQEAARLLPGLSQTLLALAEAQAVSLVELQRIRAQTVASLEATGGAIAGRQGLQVPHMSTGTNYVPEDMLAVVHRGEAVVPAAYNPAAGGGRSGSAEGLLQELVLELRRHRSDSASEALALVRLGSDLNRLLKKWDIEGIPEERQVAA